VGCDRQGAGEDSVCGLMGVDQDTHKCMMAGMSSTKRSLTALLVVIAVVFAVVFIDSMLENIKARNDATNPEGQHKLGVNYQREGDYESAAKFYRLAADQGVELAQIRLAVLLENGSGVPIDKKEAHLWYLKAAEQGNAEMQNLVGFHYSTGTLVKQDKQEAVKWYQLAANQGHATAQYNLAENYRSGSGGLQKNKVRALAWFILAELDGYEFAPNSIRNSKEEMSAEEIMEAESLARELTKMIDANKKTEK